MTEIHRVSGLPGLVSRLTGTGIGYIANPCDEAPENELPAGNRQPFAPDLALVTLKEELLREITEIAVCYRDWHDPEKIPLRSRRARR